MAKNDFSSEVTENYEQKCLCVFVLDISRTMRGQRIEELNKSLQGFYNVISSDETTSQRLELAIVTFGDSVNVIQSPSLIADMQFPELIATDGDTALVDAVDEAIDIVNNRKKWYKSTGQPYYRPWIILITDGEPNEGQDVSALASKIKKDTSEKKYVFLPIGVDNANMQVLQSIQGQIPAMKLKGTKFGSFFKWLSASMGTVVSSEEGSAVDLSEGAASWMDSFTI